MKIKEFFILLRSPIKKIGLYNKNFTIISNNCWGGIISRDRNLPYNSPTCGTYFFANEYIKFIKNLEYYINSELEELKINESKYEKTLRERNHDKAVLGKIKDVEIVFLHYKTFEEAKEKWDRRKKRINYKNLLVKFSDQNLFSRENYYDFYKLDYKNKLFITTNEEYKSEITTIIPDKWGCGFAMDDIKPSFKVLNVNKLLNSLKLG